MVIWAKTDAGRAEIQSRARVKERAQRNLLVVIDGRTADEVLLGQLAGISPRDFLELQALGLIAPVGQGAVTAPPATTAAVTFPSATGGATAETSPSAPSGVTAAAAAAGAAAASEPPAAAPLGPPAGDLEPAPLDYGRFTSALTRLIAKELGLRGFMLTLAVEKASSPQELLAVAERTIDQIRDRRGDASADAASRTLFGS